MERERKRDIGRYIDTKRVWESEIMRYREKGRKRAEWIDRLLCIRLFIRP